MSLNPAMLFAMFPDDLLQPIAANIHLLADALSARDPNGAKKAVDALMDGLIDYLKKHNIPPERLLEWAQMLGIPIGDVDLTTIFKGADKTPRA